MITVTPLTEPAQEQLCVDLMAASQPWLTLGFRAEALLRTLRAPGRERYVAHSGDRFAGFLLLNLQGGFVGYIQTIGIAQELRGLGCGTELMQFAEQRIFRDHANVFLCVSSFNQAARHWYEKLGYEEVGELKDFLVAGHSEWLMRKTRGPITSLAPGTGPVLT